MSLTASVSDEVKQSREQASKFLQALFDPGDQILFRPIETWSDENGRRRSQVIFKHISYRRLGLKAGTGSSWMYALGTINNLVDELNKVGAAHRANIFFGVAPRFKEKNFDEAWQIRTLRSLWADLDGTDAATAAARCERAGLPPPSIIVKSGNGVHLYWLLDQPYLIDDCGPPPAIEREFPEVKDGEPAGKPKRYIVAVPPPGAIPQVDAAGASRSVKERIYLTDATTPPLSSKALLIQDAMIGIASKIGGDHTHDLARILRVPGTMNRKDERNGRKPVPCVLEFCDATIRYPFSLFERFAEFSSDKKRRHAVKLIQLPKEKKKLTTANSDALGRLINECIVADPGQRSEKDFNVCCYAIRHGWPKEEVWSAVSSAGKFAESGRRYFNTTWDQASDEVRSEIYEKTAGAIKRRARHEDEEPAAPTGVAGGDGAVSGSGDSSGRPLQNLCNAFVSSIGGDADSVTAKTMDVIIADILKRTDSWPRRVGKSLFLHDAKDGQHQISHIDGAASLFGWLQRRCGIVDWRRGSDCVSKEEAYKELCRTAQRYDAIEFFPHEPRLQNHYYACDFPPTGDGSTITELINRFSPETEVDRQLILAMFATAFWGGKGGTRPAFIVISDFGRGVGKSKLTDMLSHLVGGTIDLSQHDDAGKMRERLLSEEGLRKKIVRLDNVKTLKFSWAELESMITAPIISGKQLYVGEASRPNNLTWIITLNGVNLSTDMAQRAVIIKLDKPQSRSGRWESETLEFIDAHRTELIGDLLGFLANPPEPLENLSRWAAWETEVLSKLPGGVDAHRMLVDRRGESDAEAEEIEMIERFFRKQIIRAGYSEGEVVHIPADIAGRWYSWATNERGAKTTSACRVLHQFCKEGRTRHLVANPSRKHGRGFLWFWTENHAAEKEKGAVSYDLNDRTERRSGSGGSSDRDSDGGF